ncbi:glycosyltransferase [Neobacillus sp. D3-1R]|uniref:glycosyltransferase n=1 Tax=Neobacillus sp. D3-1R TaxID=3445778 RepID=UPI003F9FE42B
MDNNTTRSKVLFVMRNLNGGGAEKSLLTVLSLFDYTKYEVDLFLLQQEGLFLELLPKEVNLLNLPDYNILKTFNKSLKKALPIFLKGKKFKVLYYRTKMFLDDVFFKRKHIYVRRWKNMKEVVPTLRKEYDVAIGYMEGLPTYFVIDKVIAKKKIGFVHVDYKGGKLPRQFDNYYFEQLDHIVTVSEQCKKILNECFPQYSRKTTIIKNIISTKSIKFLANQHKGFEDNFNGVKILSVGRLHKSKGFDLIIPVLEMLKKDKYNIKWYVIGDGEQREMLTELAKKYKVSDRVVFLGIKANPYPYINNCDIYLQPSRWEGYGIAVAEARALNKPVIVSSLEVFREQILDKVNGILVKGDVDGIFKGIKELLDNTELYNRIIINSKKDIIGNENEVNKIYKLF